MRRSSGLASTWRTGALANLLVLAAPAVAAALFNYAPDGYYRSVQEDEYLEWGTFWAFLLGAVLWFAASIRQFRAYGPLPWFWAGVGLLCLFVALEEISWGQRIIAYRPPVYFLEHNYQQELNLHNIVDTRWRKLALQAVIGGYGIVLPLLSLVPALGWRMLRLGLVAPPLALVPAFAATLLLYLWYPWSYTGETVELMLGLSFLFAALWQGREPGNGSKSNPVAARLLPVVGAWLLVVALGFGTAGLSRHQRTSAPGNLEAARVETASLRQDFLALAEPGQPLPTSCGKHKRLYTYVRDHRQAAALREGHFAALVAQGLPTERAQFFLDPWNAPYWIRHRCAKGGRHEVAFVYSFGPDRIRDSSRREISGDDVGEYLDLDDEPE